MPSAGRQPSIEVGLLDAVVDSTVFLVAGSFAARLFQKPSTDPHHLLCRRRRRRSLFAALGMVFVASYS